MLALMRLRNIAHFVWANPVLDRLAVFFFVANDDRSRINLYHLTFDPQICY